MTVMAPLASVTLRGLLGRRRTLLMLLLAAMPVLVGLVIRLSGGRPNPDPILDTLVVRTVMPLVALVLGAAALGSELEDGTAIFILTKPIPRWMTFLAKVLVAAGLTVALIVPTILLTGVLVAGASGTALASTLAFAAAAVLGSLAYVSIFAALSILTSRALVLGLAYVLIWEGVLAGLLEGTRFLSIRQATLGVAAALGADPQIGEPLDATVSLAVLVTATVAAFIIGSWRLAVFEVRGTD